MYRSAISSASSVEAKKSSWRLVPTQTGRPTPRARYSSWGWRSSSQAAAIEPRKSSNGRAALPVASAVAKITSESTLIWGS